MQKARAIRNAKWAMENAFNAMNGVLYGGSILNVDLEDWEINTQNRDRPGGHHFKTYFGHLDSNLNGGGDWKKAVKRKARRQFNKAARETLADYELSNEGEFE